MEIEFKHTQGDVRVYFAGDMDEFGVQKIKAVIDDVIDCEQNMRTMTFDMQGVTFVDSTGLGFLLGRYKKLRARHSELLLANVPKHVDKVFCTSGIYRYVPIVE